MLLLSGSEEQHQAFREEVVCDNQAVVMDTRPFVWGPIRTKVKFPDAVENSRKRIVEAIVRRVPLVVDIADSAPHFMEKICGEQKYKRWWVQFS